MHAISIRLRWYVTRKKVTINRMLINETIFLCNKGKCSINRLLNWFILSMFTLSFIFLYIEIFYTVCFENWPYPHPWRLHCQWLTDWLQGIVLEFHGFGTLFLITFPYKVGPLGLRWPDYSWATHLPREHRPFFATLQRSE